MDFYTIDLSSLSSPCYCKSPIFSVSFVSERRKTIDKCIYNWAKQNVEDNYVESYL